LQLKQQQTQLLPSPSQQPLTLKLMVHTDMDTMMAEADEVGTTVAAEAMDGITVMDMEGTVGVVAATKLSVTRLLLRLLMLPTMALMDMGTMIGDEEVAMTGIVVEEAAMDGSTVMDVEGMVGVVEDTRSLTRGAVKLFELDRFLCIYLAYFQDTDWSSFPLRFLFD
jgi:hypothetical protein